MKNIFLSNSTVIMSSYYPEFTPLASLQDTKTPNVTVSPAPNSAGGWTSSSKSMSPVEIGVVSVALAIALITAGLLASLIGRGR